MVSASGPESPRHRLRDTRGQAALFALLAIIGMLIPMLVGGWGLVQWLSDRARAQAAADAAALAAASTATPVTNVAVTYRDQQCGFVSWHWSWGWGETWQCSSGPVQQTTVQVRLWRGISMHCLCILPLMSISPTTTAAWTPRRWMQPSLG